MGCASSLDVKTNTGENCCNGGGDEFGVITAAFSKTVDARPSNPPLPTTAVAMAPTDTSFRRSELHRTTLLTAAAPFDCQISDEAATSTSSSSSGGHTAGLTTHHIDLLEPLQCRVMALGPVISSSSPEAAVRGWVRAAKVACAVVTLPSHCPLSLSDLEQELQLLQSRLLKQRSGVISHHFLQFYGVSVHAGRVQLAVELVQGSLADIVERKSQIPEQVLASILKLLLTSVDYLHRAFHVVYRPGLTPTSVLLTREGRVKISDFGLASAAVPGVEPLPLPALAP